MATIFVVGGLFQTFVLFQQDRSVTDLKFAQELKCISCSVDAGFISMLVNPLQFVSETFRVAL